MALVTGASSGIGNAIAIEMARQSASVVVNFIGQSHTPSRCEVQLRLTAFSPPAPQFFGDDPSAMMENENHYIIKHGIRMTAMPAWDKLLSDQQIWQTVDLLKHITTKIFRLW